MKFHAEKRKKVLEQMKENTLCVLTAGPYVKATSDESYPFCVNRNFYYLTGIDEADVILVLYKADVNREVLYIKKADLQKEKWVGKTISYEEAKEASGIEEIRYMEDLENDLAAFCQTVNPDTVYIDDEDDPIIHFGQDIVDRYDFFDEVDLENVYPVIARLRAVKTPEEIQKMREAISITNKGIKNMLDNFKPGLYECELEAYYDFVLKSNMVSTSFKTIAAGAERATVLHYSQNNQKVNDGEMVLFDLGVAVDRYCSDISRTFPINGKFSEKQRLVYDIVLRTQKKVQNACKPGVTLKDLQQVTVDAYKEELKNIGLIKEGTAQEVYNYYWHSISHSLGLDTHDVGLGKDVVLEPGMVITNEPGLYIEEWGIGVRIEDDLLVTEEGCENLSAEIIKEADEIEAYLAK